MARATLHKALRDAGFPLKVGRRGVQIALCCEQSWFEETVRFSCWLAEMHWPHRPPSLQRIKSTVDPVADQAFTLVFGQNLRFLVAKKSTRVQLETGAVDTAVELPA